MRLLVTRDDYYDAAMRILATEGAGGLKIATLCAELGVTTGSFYGYFGSIDGFIGQFLDHWWESQTARIVAAGCAGPLGGRRRRRAAWGQRGPVTRRRSPPSAWSRT